MPQLSLLWPSGRPTQLGQLPANTVRDLELEAIIQAMCTNSVYHRDIRAVLSRPCLDEATIRYRQDIFRDLLDQPALAAQLNTLLPLLEELTRFTFLKIGRGNPLQEIIGRARELELLVEIVRLLHESFSTNNTSFQSSALRALHDQINSLTADRQFQQLAADLPALLEALRSKASITIGVNLDHHLRPEAALLLSVNEERFTDSSLLDRLLGKGAGAGKGIAPIHRPPELYQHSDPVSGDRSARQRLDPLMLPLFKDLAKVMEKISAPVAQELKKYVQINGRFLAEIYPELIFYIQAWHLLNRLQEAGLPFTFPEILPADKRAGEVKAAYNLQLAMQKIGDPERKVISNDIHFGPHGRIAILTGPNQGGKTTYMQSVGLVQLLAQVGMPVPGISAEISPVDAIYTHYPVEERLELGTGRFGDEARRIRSIFEKVTGHSLVLFNESLSTTSMGEGVYLARDILAALRQVGLRAIFTTHLHELAADAEKINDQTPGDSLIFSLVASKPEDGKDSYSYRIKPGPPLGRSYADHIAARYGISDEQLRALLKERGLI